MDFDRFSTKDVIEHEIFLYLFWVIKIGKKLHFHIENKNPCFIHLELTTHLLKEKTFTKKIISILLTMEHTIQFRERNSYLNKITFTHIQSQEQINMHTIIPLFGP